MKAQGATEYLVLVGVVLMIALVCVAILVWPTGTTKDTKKSQTDIQYKIKALDEDFLSGMVAYFHLNEGSGTVAYDSKSGLNGTLTNGPTWVEGKSGYALNFDSNNDYVSLSNLNVDTSPGARNTVAFWMNWEGGNVEMPFGWASYDLFLYQSCFGFNTNNADVLGVSSTGFANNWKHVAAVFYNGVPNATNVDLYIDGVKQTLSLCIGASTLNESVTTSAFISGYLNSTSYKFGGKIDEVMIFNRAITPDEAYQIYLNPDKP